MRRAMAPVKAPFSWPNSSLSSRFSGIAAQLTEMNGLSARVRFAVDVARQHFLAGAALAGDQDRGIARRDLVGERDHRAHRLVFEDQLVAFVGDGGEHGGDQLGVGRQRQVFLGAGADRVDGAARIGADAAGDDRGADALGDERAHQLADVERDIAEHEVGAAAAAQARRAPARCRSACVTLAPRSIAILVAAPIWPCRLPMMRRRMSVIP